MTKERLLELSNIMREIDAISESIATFKNEPEKVKPNWICSSCDALPQKIFTDFAENLINSLEARKEMLQTEFDKG